MNKKIEIKNDEITADFINSEVSRVLANAEQIDAVFMCFATKENGKDLNVVWANGNRFDLLDLTAKCVPAAAEDVAVNCIKKISGPVEVKKDAE